MISIQSMLLEKVNERLQNSEKTRKRMAATRKVLRWDAGETGTTFLIENGRVAIASNDLKPDIVITASTDDVLGIMQKKLDPMEAYSSGKLKIKASLLDKLLMAELLK
ncbi:MAG: SCP2 sterol-binding domain-containing protein [Candidatus Thermoplasmatota archaeon]|nr:SCP2 sterol-binding domain-containing protein [Candidatus Thermoplasmatota archaeon]MCL5731788.1 SCP2 sterol-binding domain-containing protein [Candidatus Thermoplasmatota archaeon]WMT45480.1 MAG: SCP2 sterol-binding domain-containing protein [Cuniculiplasma divulgatum]